MTWSDVTKLCWINVDAVHVTGGLYSLLVTEGAFLNTPAQVKLPKDNR